MSILSEFKDFAIKGNMVDMAVGIIIGAAFGGIISSLVADVIMPLVGLAVGGVDFTTMAVTLKEASGDTEAVTLKYGKFIQTVFDFLIVAFAIFIGVKWINSLKKKAAEEEEVAGPSNEEVLLSEIRDLLRK